MPRPRLKAAPGPVERWFVLNRRGEVYDGPFKTKSAAEGVAEQFRDQFSEEPVVKQEMIRPIPQSVWMEHEKDGPAF